jgi:aminomethyltransferase
MTKQASLSQASGRPLIAIGPRVRKSPYFDATLRHGARAFTVYNHMYMPTSYTDPVSEYWSLVNDVTLWDVAGERQVEIIGPDALEFVQRLTPRDMARCQVGQCQYLVLTGEDGGIINDAVLLRLDEQRFWISPGDGDVLLWASGVAVHSGLQVSVFEPDVSPLQLQGPNAPHVASALFGEWAVELGYYRLRETELDGIPLVLARTGWSGELGYELYLQDGRHGDALWERVMDAGKSHGIVPIAPSTIRSVEGGLLSYVSDIRRTDDPFVLGMDRLVDLDKASDFIGKAALSRIRAEGPRRRLVGVEMDGNLPGGSNENFWPVLSGDEKIGHVTRLVRSPRLEKNIGFANLPVALSGTGTELAVVTPFGKRRLTVCESPWFARQTRIPRPL